MPRLPLGIIVEGQNEWHSFNGLIHKICKNTGNDDLLYRDVPIVSADGNGGIMCHLEEHLRDLCRTHAPLIVIVCMDLREKIRDGSFPTCVDLKIHLEKKADTWLKAKEVNEEQLPVEIIIVIQVQQLESWILADIQGIMRYCRVEGIQDAELPECWINVDIEEVNPARRLEILLKGKNIKNRYFARGVFSHCNVGTMSEASRSFRKFYKEIEEAMSYYRDYLANS